MSGHRLATLAIAAASAAVTFDAAAEAPVAPPAELFAPGTVSGPANDWAPAFSPDGKTVYFGRSGASWGFILESHLTDQGWSEPVIAPFSGEYPDSSPAMAPDGSYIVFQSQRPATAALTAEQRANHSPLKASALWKVARAGGGWGTPERLPDSVNINGNMWKPSVAADGDLYFITKAAGEKNLHLYRSRYQDGGYLQAEPLPFGDGSTLDVDPAVAADGSYLVFSSKGRAPFKDDHEHLFLVFRAGAGWGRLIPVCDSGPGNSSQTLDDDAMLAPDQRTLYFASDRSVAMHLPKSRAEAEQAVRDMQGWNNGNANVWSMPLGPWLDAAKAGQPAPACG